MRLLNRGGPIYNKSASFVKRIWTRVISFAETFGGSTVDRAQRFEIFDSEGNGRGIMRITDAASSSDRALLRQLVVDPSDEAGMLYLESAASLDGSGDPDDEVVEVTLCGDGDESSDSGARIKHVNSDWFGEISLGVPAFLDVRLNGVGQGTLGAINARRTGLVIKYPNPGSGTSGSAAVQGIYVYMSEYDDAYPGLQIYNLNDDVNSIEATGLVKITQRSSEAHGVKVGSNIVLDSDGLKTSGQIRVNTTNYYSTDGTAGTTGSVVVADTSGNPVTLNFKNGLFVGAT